MRFQLKGEDLLMALNSSDEEVAEWIHDWLDNDVRNQVFFEGEEPPFKNLEDQWFDITIDRGKIDWIICEDINTVGNQVPVYTDKVNDYTAKEIVELISLLQLYGEAK